jgi:hypothetical protein
VSAYPALTVKVAFASNPNDSSLVWTDISAYARQVATARGRQRLLRTMAQFQAGTCSLQLDNRDRRFDPTNTASPYYPNVQPEKPIQIGATWQGTYYPIWTGQVDDWAQAWPGIAEARIDLSATDLFKSLAIKRVLSSGYSTTVLATSGLLAYYRFGEPAPATGQPPTTVAVDTSPARRDGTYEGTYTLGAAGALTVDPNTAFSCGTYTGMMQGPGSAAPSGTTDFTIEAWFKTTANDSVLRPIYWAGGQNIMVAVQNGQLKCSAVGLGGIPVAVNVHDGFWHHVVFVRHYDGTNTNATIYLDGAQVFTGSVAGAPTSIPVSSAIYVGGADPSAQPVSGPLFWGDIDELSVATTALTGAQVLARFQAATFPAQYSGQRVAALLNTLGIPASRQRVDTGRTWCAREVADQSATKALLYAQRSEQTEQGQLYVAADGTVVFEDRYHRYLNPNSTPVAVFGDGGTGYLRVAGTGSPSGFQFTSNPSAGSVPASGDELWTISGHIDATSSNGGYWGIFDQAGNVLVGAYQSSGVNGDVSAEVTLGSSVTRINAFADTVNATIASGQYLTFSKPRLRKTGQRIAGTGSPLGYQAGGQIYNVRAGQILTLTATVDARYVTAASPSIMILNPDTGSSFTGAIAYATAGQISTITCTARIPAGVTRAQFLWDTSNCTVTSGQYLVYSGMTATIDYVDVGPLSATNAIPDPNFWVPADWNWPSNWIVERDEISYDMDGLAIHFDRSELYNEVPATRAGGTTQIASDPASITEFGNRTVVGGLSEMFMASDADAMYCAQWVLADTKLPRQRVDDLKFTPVSDSRLWPLLLGAEIGTVVTVVKHNIPGGGGPITVNCRLEGVDHRMDPPRSWKTTWHVSVMGTQPWLILGDPVMGLLDSGARWGW